MKKLFSMMDAFLRDRDSLYQMAADGQSLGRLCAKLLLIFLLATALYGATMGSFRSFHPEFVFSDFVLSYPEGESVAQITKKVAGMNVETRTIYVDDPGFHKLSSPRSPDVPVSAPADCTVRFNVTHPTEPYRVASLGEEDGYGVIELAPGAALQEQETWRLPLLVAGKTPALFLLTLLVCSLALYVLNVAFGAGLRFLPTMTLMTFGLAATGIMLGVFFPIVLLFTAVTENYHFVKVLNTIVFAIAGLFGVKVLYQGLVKLVPDEGKGINIRRLVFSWLLLYCFVGGQLAWMLKPWFGTPYLPATPPFRIESGNLYVTFFGSLSQLFGG